jgi:hypothetical protein
LQSLEVYSKPRVLSKSPSLAVVQLTRLVGFIHYLRLTSDPKLYDSFVTILIIMEYISCMCIYIYTYDHCGDQISHQFFCSSSRIGLPLGCQLPSHSTRKSVPSRVVVKDLRYQEVLHLGSRERLVPNHQTSENYSINHSHSKVHHKSTNYNILQ